jgi:formate C-acetyltransferase
VQITVTSPEELQDAMIHPEAHEDLIVRVGGYSEYFNRLTPALKAAVLERNVHEL